MTAAPPAAQPLERFPIAGVGASAGGLAATTELLRHLGPQPNIAVVVVHHLDPSHESSLGDLLSRATPLPVHAALDGMPIEVNHVYVGLPGVDLGLVDGRLALTPRVDTGNLHLPIDRFLQALAAEHTRLALGVVLTGTGADGSAGIEAIKASGGITFAQDASAEHRSMPDSAIATGCVDFVLAPAAIAREMSRIGRRVADGSPPGASPDQDEAADFHRVLSILRQSSGIDFANYKENTLLRRLQRRMVIKSLPNLREYAAFLEGSPEEAQMLCDDVLIHVTSFFRDPEMFAALKTTVFPRLLENRPKDAPVRVWVPGCSTGEEVYSIAMCLLEFLGEAGAVEIPVKLFGTDVSSSAIDKARAGRYPASIESDVSPARLARFFSKAEGSYRIRKEVRDLAIFARQDATRDPPFAGMDLISCRNLIIYLGVPLQERLLPIFHYALKELGFLVLGTSESVRSYPGFVPLDGKNKIYARSPAAPRQILDFADSRLAELPPHGGAPGAKPSLSQDVHREVDRLVLAQFAPPAVVITDNLAIVEFRGRTGPFLGPTAGVASFDLMRMVREELRVPLRQSIDDARAKQSAVRRICPALGPAAPGVEIEVIPFRVASAPQSFFVVLFRDDAWREPGAPGDGALAPAAGTPGESDHQLAQQLASTRDYLQSVVEQLEDSNEELRAANEEIVSSNEELRSTNEEMQMGKEELQATNEELRTVNDELKARNDETKRLSDDLANVLNSAEIPIVLLGRDSRIRRFTPVAARLFRLIPSDVGRPLADIKSMLSTPELPQMFAEALRVLRPAERTVQDEEGRWYQITVLPYVTSDNRIDGAVITAVDIDAVKKEALLRNEARKYAEVIDTIHECLVVLDQDGRITSANRAFLRMVGLNASGAQGRLLYDLDGTAWNLPALRARLEAVGDGDAVEDYRLERNVEGGGRRVLVLNARRIEHTASTLVAIEDVTEKEAADVKVRDYQEKIRQMAFDGALTEERERRRIAAEVHDHVGQSLALAEMKLTSIREAIAQAPRAVLDEAAALIERSIVEIRTLIFDLSPPILYDLGLKEALSWLAEQIDKKHGLRIEVSDDGRDKPLEDATAALVFRGVREILTNVSKHARTDAAKIGLRRIGDQLQVDVEDKGVGFDPKEVDTRTGGVGFGLFSVREQIGRLGGTVVVASAPGRGTRVTIGVPLKTGDPETTGARTRRAS